MSTGGKLRQLKKGRNNLTSRWQMVVGVWCYRHVKQRNLYREVVLLCLEFYLQGLISQTQKRLAVDQSNNEQPIVLNMSNFKSIKKKEKKKVLVGSGKLALDVLKWYVGQVPKKIIKKNNRLSGSDNNN